MDVVVTEELRGRSGLGRRLIAAEEKIEWDLAAERAAKELAARICHNVVMKAYGERVEASNRKTKNKGSQGAYSMEILQEIISDPHLSLGPHTLQNIRNDVMHGQVTGVAFKF